jgi:hypothetical protein
MRPGRSLSASGLRRLIGLLVPVVFALALLLALSGAASAQGRYVAFDCPAATATFTYDINDAGQIVGTCTDSAGIHSFLRNSDRSIVTFDPAGSIGSQATSVNINGEITGYWYSSSGGIHGYYRSAEGAITTFDAVGTGQYGTLPTSINDAGSITGDGGDATRQHGFVRDASGAVTLFDPPESTVTYAENINQSGFIAGTYFDSVSALHTFIRNPTGDFVIVDAPGAGTGGGQGTTGGVLNNRGQLTGSYIDTKYLDHGFLRDWNGVYTTFDAANVLITQGGWINNSGEIIGYGNKRAGLNVSYLRSPSGVITEFQAPGSGLGLSNDQGTRSIAVNSSGTIAGYYYDATQVPHGFVRY